MSETITLAPSRAARSLTEVARRSPLRLALSADSAVTAVNGVAYLAAAEPLADLLGLSPELLRGAGAFLVAFAALVALAARASRPARALVAAIVAANVVWALDSLVAAAAGWGSPTTAGTVWIAVQGVAVAGLAGAQVAARRHEGRRA